MRGGKAHAGGNANGPKKADKKSPLTVSGSGTSKKRRGRPPGSVNAKNKGKGIAKNLDEYWNKENVESEEKGGNIDYGGPIRGGAVGSEGRGAEANNNGDTESDTINRAGTGDTNDESGTDKEEISILRTPEAFKSRCKLSISPERGLTAVSEIESIRVDGNMTNMTEAEDSENNNNESVFEEAILSEGETDRGDEGNTAHGKEMLAFEEKMVKLLNTWKENWECAWKTALKREMESVKQEMNVSLQASHAKRQDLEDELMLMQAKLWAEESKWENKCANQDLMIQAQQIEIGQLQSQIWEMSKDKESSKEKVVRQRGKAEEDENGNSPHTQNYNKESTITDAERESLDAVTSVGEENRIKSNSQANQYKQLGSKHPRRSRQRKRPGRLSNGEWAREIEERERRKRNIVIRGLEKTKRPMEENIRVSVEEQTGIKPGVRRWKWTDKGLLVELDSSWNKAKVMKNNFRAKASDRKLQIMDDWTNREVEVQRWIEEEAEELRQQGEFIRTGHQKMQVQGTWIIWNELEGHWSKMREKTKPRGFRDKRREYRR